MILRRGTRQGPPGCSIGPWRRGEPSCVSTISSTKLRTSRKTNYGPMVCLPWASFFQTSAERTNWITSRLLHLPHDPPPPSLLRAVQHMSPSSPPPSGPLSMVIHPASHPQTFLRTVRPMPEPVSCPSGPHACVDLPCMRSTSQWTPSLPSHKQQVFSRDPCTRGNPCSERVILRDPCAWLFPAPACAELVHAV